MSSEAGVNPVEAMNEAEQAEELAIRSASAAPELEALMENLTPAVSSYVSPGLSSLDIKLFDNISQLAQNSVNLAQDVQGADLEIAAADHENAEEFREGTDILDIPINF